MRLVQVVTGVVIAAATIQVAIAPVSAAGEAVVQIATSQSDPALAWHIDVLGGSPSTDLVTLERGDAGYEGEFTVDVTGSKATVVATTVLRAGWLLASVDCLDASAPLTEISPVLDRSSFALDVMPGRAYRCFVTSGPNAAVDPAAPVASSTPSPSRHPLPRSDAAAPPPSTPGWLAVLLTLVAICGVAVLLRPVRR